MDLPYDSESCVTRFLPDLRRRTIRTRRDRGHDDSLEGVSRSKKAWSLKLGKTTVSGHTLRPLSLPLTHTEKRVIDDTFLSCLLKIFLQTLSS